MAEPLEPRLRQLLEEHRYESKMGLGQRGLQKHHIDALMADLVPFIQAEYNRGVENGVKLAGVIGQCRI